MKIGGNAVVIQVMNKLLVLTSISPQGCCWLFMRWFWLLFFAIITTENNATASDSSEDIQWHAGLNRLTVDGRDRTFILDLPKITKQGAPLVLVFHGYYDTAESVRKYAGFTSLVNQYGFVAVYPQGTLDHEGSAFFNVGYEDNTLQEREVDDVKFIRVLVAALVKDLKLDARSVFATGMSNGADMSYLLACQSKPLVNSIAPVAGTMMISWHCDPHQRVSVMEIHGTDDDTTPWIGDLENHDGEGAYLGTQDVMDFWVRNLALEKNENKELGIARVKKNRTATVRLHRWSTAVDATEVSLYELQGGKHDWPLDVGEAQGSTAEVIWRFFESHRLTNKIIGQ